MAGGLSYKFNGSEIAIATEFETASPPQAISAITSANPPVVTSTTHGLSSGDIVTITTVVGMTELNGKTFIVDVLNANSFELFDTDATGYGTYVSGGQLAVGAFAAFCDSTSFSQTGGTATEIDTTTICSTRRENVLGLSDVGTAQLDYNFAHRTSTVQLGIEAANRAGSLIGLRLTLSDDGGSRVYLGRIQQLNVSGANDGIWTGSMTIRFTGDYFDYDAA
jgi:aspartate aminotransferase-like enzyme